MHYPRMKPRPTTPGAYVVSGAGPYHTPRWPLSRIAWGTPIRLDLTGKHLLYQTGLLANGWRRVDHLIPEVTTAELLDDFHRRYGPDRTYDRDGDGVPDVWVFNDFGPVAINYFRDPNRNRKVDRGEKIMGEMIHTTPATEAATDRHLPAVPLESSHGCIHIRPADLRRFSRLGAFKPGTLIFVHGPNEVVPELLAK